MVQHLQTMTTCLRGCSSDKIGAMGTNRFRSTSAATRSHLHISWCCTIDVAATIHRFEGCTKHPPRCRALAGADSAPAPTDPVLVASNCDFGDIFRPGVSEMGPGHTESKLSLDHLMSCQLPSRFGEVDSLWPHRNLRPSSLCRDPIRR